MLSVAIVTRNTRGLLENLLSTIGRDASLAPLLKEIIVVDNASSDGTDSMLRDRFPSVRRLANERNRGFAAAVNQGLSASSGEFLLLLNSDTVLPEGEIAKLHAFMEAHPDVGIAGPQLIYQDMRLQRSTAPVPSLGRELLPGRFLHRPSQERREVVGQGARDVESLIGAAVMIRTEAMRSVGGFDERFFFFLEETDFCVRARAAGYRVVFVPDVRVIHLQGRTVQRNWVRGRIQYAISLYAFLRKYHSRAYVGTFAGVRILKALIAIVVTSCLPFLLFSRSTRMRYAYYWALILWHLKGCPEDAGLRPTTD